MVLSRGAPGCEGDRQQSKRPREGPSGRTERFSAHISWGLSDDRLSRVAKGLEGTEQKISRPGSDRQTMRHHNVKSEARQQDADGCSS